MLGCLFLPLQNATIIPYYTLPTTVPYFYSYKPSPRILRQHRVQRNLKKNKDVVITKPDKGNEVVILDRKLYNSTIKEIISDTSKFEKLSEDPTLKRKASVQRFFTEVETKKLFLMKLNMMNCIRLVLLLLVYIVLLKCTSSPLVILFLNFVRLFHQQVLLIIILPISFVIFFHLQFPMITLADILFLLFLKLKMQIFPKISCFLRCNQSLY